MWRVVIAAPLFLGGLFFLTVGTIGLLRLPDIYTRMHATGKCDTLGAGLMLMSLMILAPSWAVLVKYVLLVGLIIIINPTTAHIIANVAYRYGGMEMQGTVCVDFRRPVDAGETATDPTAVDQATAPVEIEP
jgi:multicomponent Na+:H+ antiporter subunit G